MARPRTVSNEQILNVARACFLREGPAVSTQKIAESLGISQPALFKRFGSKHALMLAALLPAGIPPWVQALESGPDRRPFLRQVREVCESALSFFEELGPVMAVLRSAGVTPRELLAQFHEPPPARAIAAFSAWLSRCHRAGLIRKVNFDLTALSFIGAMHSKGFLTYAMGHPPVDESREEYAKTVADLYTRALRRTQ